jgi:hypothetical protein
MHIIAELIKDMSHSSLEGVFGVAGIFVFLWRNRRVRALPHPRDPEERITTKQQRGAMPPSLFHRTLAGRGYTPGLFLSLMHSMR